MASDAAPGASVTGPDNLLAQARDWQDAGHGVAIATVVSTWGSSPRPVGSQLIVSDAQEMEGSVSGGCVEGAVVEQALQTIGDGQPRCSISASPTARPGKWASPAAAISRSMWNGWTRRKARATRKTMRRELLDQLIGAQSAKQPAVVVTDIGTGDQALLVAPAAGTEAVGNLKVDDALRQAAIDVLRADKGTTVEAEGSGPLFVQPFNPPLRMAIVGAVHIAQALAPMATIAGYEVTVIDPRHGFASEIRFPEVTVVDDWPG